MILIAPDKFKGSLTARQACDIIAKALRSCGYSDLLLCPMADGGEGTPHSLNAPRNSDSTESKQIPVILSHDYVGPQSFADIPLIRRSSFALGEAVRSAYQPGKCLYIGLGGTAVCDGGAGFLQALGLRFYDSNDNLVSTHITPESLPHLSRAEGLDEIINSGFGSDVEVLYDVKASLLPKGESLSALDFVAQKGATDSDIPTIIAGLGNLKRILSPKTESPCDGAAGGLGFALCSALGARSRVGAAAVLDSYNIDWNAIDLVISGEGRIDAQTSGGKVPGYMKQEAERHGVPCLLIGGYVEPRLRTACCISTIECETDYNSDLAAERLHKAAERANEWLRKAIIKR